MMSAAPLCSRVSDGLHCPACKQSSCIIKNGSTKTGKQQYYCKNCSKRFIACYTYNAYQPAVNGSIVKLTKEGLGIRSIARYLRISCTTVLKRILKISVSLSAPVTISSTYEVDEVHTYIGNKSRAVWIVYALERNTGNVAGFNIGNRSTKTIAVIIDRLALLSAQRIYTDQLSHYRSIVPKSMHKVTPYGTNHIERKNLTLRTHLKRLSRRTICFSRSAAMLIACLKIYFWG